MPTTTFKPAKIRNNSNGFYVEFYTYNFDISRYKTKRIYLSDIPEDRREVYARNLVEKLNKKLKSDWLSFEVTNKYVQLASEGAFKEVLDKVSC